MPNRKRVELYGITTDITERCAELKQRLQAEEVWGLAIDHIVAALKHIDYAEAELLEARRVTWKQEEQ